MRSRARSSGTRARRCRVPHEDGSEAERTDRTATVDAWVHRWRLLRARLACSHRQRGLAKVPESQSLTRNRRKQRDLTEPTVCARLCGALLLARITQQPRSGRSVSEMSAGTSARPLQMAAPSQRSRGARFARAARAVGVRRPHRPGVPRVPAPIGVASIRSAAADSGNARAAAASSVGVGSKLHAAKPEVTLSQPE